MNIETLALALRGEGFPHHMVINFIKEVRSRDETSESNHKHGPVLANHDSDLDSDNVPGYLYAPYPASYARRQATPTQSQ